MRINGEKPMKAIENIKEQYDCLNRKKYLILAISTVVIIVFGFFFMTLGVTDTSVLQVVKAIKAWLCGNLNSGSSVDNAAYKIIVLMRLPRIVIAVVAGIGMAVGGTAMQSVTRNPLVSPFTIGVSSAAAFGASMCIVFATNVFLKSEIGIILCAFVASITCVLLVYVISSKVGMGAETVVLTGIALNYFFSALTSTVEFFAQEHKLAAVVQWTFGTFNGITWREVIITSVVVFLCSLILMLNSLKLNVMSSGDDELVRSLGISPQRVRAVTGLASVLMTAAIISFTGVIGFVGLVAPHIARRLVGNNHKFLIPFSGIVGAMLLMVADAIGKTILSPVSIPVGIVVSFLGVSLFIHLILKDKRGKCQ